MRTGLLSACALILTACGGATPDASTRAATDGAGDATHDAATDGGKTADAPEGEKSAGKPAAEPAGLPDKCETKNDLCLPPPGFVKRLCGGFHPDIALILFGKGTPFSRGYLAANVEAWNASGGASSNDKLAFDEEVIVLLKRKADTGGMQVSGSEGGSFDVLRWDGTCATLSGAELTFKSPPAARTAKVVFKDLGTETQDALLANEKIAKLNADRRKECQGVTMGTVSAKCAKLVDQLSETIVQYVRDGGTVPKPSKLP